VLADSIQDRIKVIEALSKLFNLLIKV